MKMSLIVGFRPKTNVESSFVFLKAGRWLLRYEGVVDSLFQVVVRNAILHPLGLNFAAMNGYEITLPYDADIKLLCVKAGTEDSINIYAEAVT